LSNTLADLKRLVRHWPIYPALAVWLLWCFSPGSATPLQFFMQNTLRATDAQWGEWNAIFVAGFIPTFLLFGWLCRRVRLRSLLFWGTLVAVPQMVPLAFIHSVNQALVAAAIIGLLGGVCTAAYTDLIIRSCPPGLQGAVLMMFWALYYIAARFGDILGADLYDRFHNFNACVIAITAVYALILPTLWLVPRRLTATVDGEVAA
jgi:MFS family permease